MFLIGILLLPCVTVYGLTLRSEMILIPVLFGILLLRRSFSLAFPRVSWLLFSLWLWIFLVSLIGVLTGSADRILWANVYAYLRPVLVLLMFYNLALDQTGQGRLGIWPLRYFIAHF
ncbi:hypothetical protein E308F_28130 [Moorella sp. E308F]|nr:hypothetical protein E308F_28130 [Moorella sp. E308F]